MFNEKDLTTGKVDKNIDQHIKDIAEEFKNGFEFIKKYPKSVTIFGSSRLTEASSHYHEARRLAERIVTEIGYTIITGGGPGIMEAANRGAKEAGGKSVGLNITIPHEQHTNGYTEDNIEFNYFFSRKTMLNFAAEAYIFFPGGYGTFDELFGLLTLIQTKKVPQVPIILFGKDFWGPIVEELFKKQMLNMHHTIEDSDMELFVITNSTDNVIKVIKEAPVSAWWKMVD